MACVDCCWTVAVCGVLLECRCLMCCVAGLMIRDMACADLCACCRFVGGWCVCVRTVDMCERYANKD